jgi:hypothetical protein
MGAPPSALTPGLHFCRPHVIGMSSRWLSHESRQILLEDEGATKLSLNEVNF